MDKTIIETNEEKKPYTLRRLKDCDLYPILKIIGDVFPEDLSSVFMQVMSGQKNVNEVGAAMIGKLIVAVLKNMNKVRDDVYEFLSSVSGIPVEELGEMEFGTTPKMIWDIVKNEKNASFFTELSKLS